MAPAKAGTGRIVSLFDVDNTLLDNDRITEDLRGHLECAVGPERQKQYWTIFEALRKELGYADYLGALQQYRREHGSDPHLLTVSSFLVNYPFADRLFPHVRDVLAQCKAWGRIVIVTDGDVVFQPRKIERSGLGEATDGEVLIYIHKEREVADVERRYPADHYLLVDDKLRILTAVKQRWGPRVTTVFPRQGHYAHDPAILAQYPPADVTLDHVGDLLGYTLEALIEAARS